MHKNLSQRFDVTGIILSKFILMSDASAAFNPSYVGVRADVAALVSPGAKAILDVGCSIGTLGAFLKERQGATVTGIELSPEMGAVAKQRLDQVFIGDASAIVMGDDLGDATFDTIIFADVLEHLIDPWSVVKAATRRLSPGGVIVTSIPNIRHIDTIFNLVVRGSWPMRDRGIHDRTHLRFFTKTDALNLFTQAGLSVAELRTHYRLFEYPHAANEYARYFAWPGLRGFLAFQYLIVAGRAG